MSAVSEVSVTRLEKQLWAQLREAEASVDKMCSLARDRVVCVLQYEDREGREASEAGDRTQSG